MAIVFLITHGAKTLEPNPGLTQEGIEEITQLRSRLPSCITDVVCGTGRRHLETAKTLGLTPTRYSSIVGVAESKIRGKGVVLLADGTQIPYKLYTSIKDREEAFFKLVESLPDNSVVITSRVMPRLLGFSYGKQSAIYHYDTQTGEIEEVFAASLDIGAGDQEV